MPASDPHVLPADLPGSDDDGAADDVRGAEPRLALVACAAAVVRVFDPVSQRDGNDDGVLARISGVCLA
jgi:hypothetical protein